MHAVVVSIFEFWVALLSVYLFLQVIQEYVLGEYDPDATDAYHDNHTSESADEDHVKDTSKRYYTKSGKKDTNNKLHLEAELSWMNIWFFRAIAGIMSMCTQTGLSVISQIYRGTQR